MTEAIPTGNIVGPFRCRRCPIIKHKKLWNSVFCKDALDTLITSADAELQRVITSWCLDL